MNILTAMIGGICDFIYRHGLFRARIVRASANDPDVP